MVRNLKTLGLALMAILALGALAASAASAQTGKLTSTSSMTLLGTHTASTVNALTSEFSAGSVTKTECPEATYTGHKVNVTPHEKVPVNATETTITPHYRHCTTAGFASTVDMNGCDYRFKLGATTGGVAHTYGVEAFVDCSQSGGKDIQITLFTSTAQHTTGDKKPWCTATITEKATAYTGLHATDLTNKHIRIHGTMEGIETHRDRGTHASLFPCAEGTDKNAKLHLDITVAETSGVNIDLTH